MEKKIRKAMSQKKQRKSSTNYNLCHVEQERVNVEDRIHCLHCSLVFIDGKVNIKEGKILKLARVEYPLDGGENSSNVTDEPLFGEKDKKSNITKKAEKKFH